MKDVKKQTEFGEYFWRILPVSLKIRDSNEVQTARNSFT
jgi:hypothetical protein